MAERSLKRRSIKTGAVAPRKVEKPHCPTHSAEMKFDTLRMVWSCPEFDCKMVAHPPDEIGGKRPVGFEGEFELLIVIPEKAGRLPKVVLRKDKVFFDVTEHVTTMDRQDQDTTDVEPPDGTQVRPQKTEQFLLELNFNGATIIDSEGKPSSWPL